MSSSSSSAVASSSSNAVAQEPGRPEAGPLPRKIGELGYVAPELPEMREINLNDDAPSAMPARHPADRDSPPGSNTTNADASTASSSNSATTTAAGGSSSGTDAESLVKKVRKWHIAGIHFASFLRLALLLMLMAGTGVAWWYTVMRFNQTMNGASSSNSSSDSDNSNSNSNSNGNAGTSGFSSTVFVHVAFAVVALFELIFLERTVFQMRAERYMFVHGMSPNAVSAASLGIAPWNRPSLPTYAAALAETGHGTGDVEDNLIAIAPPPAYGNTRGSTLLLSSMLPSNLMRTFSRASQRSTTSRSPSTPTATTTEQRRRSPEAEMEEGRRSRPISYERSEEVTDAARARALENALARLELNSTPLPGAAPSSSSGSGSRS